MAQQVSLASPKIILPMVCYAKSYPEWSGILGPHAPSDHANTKRAIHTPQKPEYP